jgi:hypothetical protein
MANKTLLEEQRKIYIEEINEHGVTSRGKTLMLKFLNGESLSASQAIKANCFCCMGYESREDCEMSNCPLYNYMPYNKKRKKKVMSETNIEGFKKRMLENRKKK